MVSTDPSPDAQAVAVAAGRAMFERDRAVQSLGVELVDIGPGFARTAMTVGEDMVNGHGTCHGGVTFLLADAAFAYACNSHNRTAVARSASIEFAAAARVGDRLTATAEERNVTGRTGVYDVEVTDQSGRTIALFRGVSTRIKGEVVGDPTERS